MKRFSKLLATAMAGLTALASTSCGVIPGLGEPDDLGSKFEALVEADGSNEVRQLKLTYEPTTKDWSVSAVLGTDDRIKQLFGDNLSANEIYSPIPAPPVAMTGDDINQIFAEQEDRMNEICSDYERQAPEYVMHIMPSGARASWINCAVTTYAFGSSQLDGEDVRDFYDPTDPAQVEEIIDVTNRIFPDRQVVKYADSWRSFIVTVTGTDMTRADGSICVPEIDFNTVGPGQELVVDDNGIEKVERSDGMPLSLYDQQPLVMFCDENTNAAVYPSDQPFDLNRYDPDGFAEMRQTAADYSGLSAEDFNFITYISHDGSNLEVYIEGNGNRLIASMEPTR